MDSYAKSMWTPEGERPLREKDVIPLNPKEIRLLADLHEFMQKHQLSIVCPRCDSAITGQNNDSPDLKFVSVQCLCRQWRFDRR